MLLQKSGRVGYVRLIQRLVSCLLVAPQFGVNYCVCWLSRATISNEAALFSIACWRWTPLLAQWPSGERLGCGVGSPTNYTVYNGACIDLSTAYIGVFFPGGNKVGRLLSAQTSCICSNLKVGWTGSSPSSAARCQNIDSPAAFEVSKAFLSVFDGSSVQPERPVPLFCDPRSCVHTEMRSCLCWIKQSVPGLAEKVHATLKSHHVHL